MRKIRKFKKKIAVFTVAVFIFGLFFMSETMVSHAVHSGGSASNDTWFVEYTTYSNNFRRQYITCREFSKDSVNVPIAVFVTGSVDLQDGNGGVVSCPTYRLCYYNASSNYNFPVNVSVTELAYNMSNGSLVYEHPSNTIDYLTPYPNFTQLSAGGSAYNSFSTNIPMFDDEVCLLRYFETGDDSGRLNGSNMYVPDEFNIGFLNFTGGTDKLHFSWDGLTMDGIHVYGKGKNDIPLSPDPYLVDIELQFHNTQDDGYEGSYNYYSLSGASYFLVDDKQLILDASVVFDPSYVTEHRYVSAIVFWPLFKAPASSEYKYFRGKSVTFIYDNPQNGDKLFDIKNDWSYEDYLESLDGTVSDDSLVTEFLDEDFYFSEIHTGIEWLDTLLNYFVKFFNALLRAIYRIRDLIYNKDGAGLFQLFERLVWLCNPMNFFKTFFTRVWLQYLQPAIIQYNKYLFLPSENFFVPYLDRLDEHFPNIMKLKGLISQLWEVLHDISGEVPPDITINLSSIQGYDLQLAGAGMRDFTISFDWFAPFRPYVHGVLSAFMVLRFALDQIFSFKSLINATGSIPTDHFPMSFY